jgi:predicted peptidase
VRHEPGTLRGLIADATPEAPAAGSIRLVQKEFPGGGIDGYSVYLPRTYGRDLTATYPVLMCLHGGSAVGGDMVGMHNWGIPRMVWEESGQDSARHGLALDSFIVVTPHLVGGQFWEHADAIDQILTEVVAEQRADPDRISLTGLSRGGHGTWGLASRLPGRFAAVAPMGGDIEGIDDFAPLVELPIWVAHTARDEVVPVSGSHEAIAAIEALGGAPFAVYDRFDLTGTDWQEQRHVFVTPDLVTHDVWTPLYERTELYEWLLSQRRRSGEAALPSEARFY